MRSVDDENQSAKTYSQHKFELGDFSPEKPARNKTQGHIKTQHKNEKEKLNSYGIN